MIKIEDFINTTESLHYQRLAKRWQFCLIKALFRDTKLTLRQETIILGYFGIHHPTYSEVEFKALTLELSAYPIDYQRTVKYLDALLAEFLTDEVKYKRSGELLLIILICLQSACRKSRIFSCQDVLDLTSDDWCPRERAFKICGGLLPVSRGLSKVIEVFIPVQNRKEKYLIFHALGSISIFGKSTQFLATTGKTMLFPCRLSFPDHPMNGLDIEASLFFGILHPESDVINIIIYSLSQGNLQHLPKRL